MKPEFIKQIEDKGYLVEIPEKDPNTAIVCLLKKGDKVHTVGYVAGMDKKIQTILDIRAVINPSGLAGFVVDTDFLRGVSASWFKKIEP